MVGKLRNAQFNQHFKSLYGFRNAVWSFLLFVALYSFPSFAATPSVGVIYPELRAPFNKIYDDIAEGVEKQANGQTKRYKLTKNYSPQKLNEWIERNNIKVAVALGKGGEKAMGQLTTDIPVVLSGVIRSKSPSYGGISLAASPNKLFTELKKQNPKVKRVIVVYNPKKTEWLVRQALSDALANNVQLVTFTTSSLSESAKIYREIFTRSDIDTSAIWLPPDTTSVDNKAILSFILEQSWAKNVTVFSSSPAHVNKGVLFAMYPDNKKLGESLGAYALDELNGGSKLNKMIPVEDLKIAFNKRTAEHLGIKFRNDQLRRYDAVFPAK